MSLNDGILGQYHASIEMLRQAVTKCPASLWADPAYQNTFWNVAYHALFYTHLYLAPSLETFVPWEQHKEEYATLKEGQEPCSKEVVLAYADFLLDHAAEQVAGLDLDAPSGFHWLAMNKLGLQFYNIRHLQQHTGELCERLGEVCDIHVEWVAA